MTRMVECGKIYLLNYDCVEMPIYELGRGVVVDGRVVKQKRGYLSNLSSVTPPGFKPGTA